MKGLSLLIHKLATRLFRYDQYYRLTCFRNQLGYCASSTNVRLPDTYVSPDKIFLYDDTAIFECSKFLISNHGEAGRFIMKQHSVAAQGLTVITGNHSRKIGCLFKSLADIREGDIDKDIIVEEDVWIGANVTILAGVTIGRGSTIGANTLINRNVPPYAVAVGNPAKVVGFNFTPEEIIEHEKLLYCEEERLPIELLQKNYDKYYLKKNHR